ncbi:MAG: EF-hand domain-containing protein [Planctomycetota bacterium]
MRLTIIPALLALTPALFAQAAEAPAPPAQGPAARGQAAFERLDANHDGVVSREEFEAFRAIRANTAQRTDAPGRADGERRGRRNLQGERGARMGMQRPGAGLRMEGQQGDRAQQMRRRMMMRRLHQARAMQQGQGPELRMRREFQMQGPMNRVRGEQGAMRGQMQGRMQGRMERPMQGRFQDGAARGPQRARVQNPEQCQCQGQCQNQSEQPFVRRGQRLQRQAPPAAE